VLLVGEAGLGKSRLVYTMKQHILGQMVEGEVDAPVIEWRCSPHFQNTGLYPAIDFYERALEFRREEPPQDRLDRLLDRLQQYNLARPETVPLWASLLSLPPPEGFPPLALSPVRKREETFRTMLDWLHTRAARKPILFVVEDLHWADASTLEFLGQYFAEGLHDSILTVLTYRPEFKAPWPAVAQQTTLALNRLTRRQVGELMRKKAESTLPEMLVEQIYDRTGGVPLFVEEFTRMVQESGALDKGEQGDALKTLLKREIPATLQDLMMARLDRMEGEREVAQLAATLGREFSYELLAAVATVDEPRLQAELGKLVQAEILYSKGKPPRCSYIFKHALLEDAAYNSLVKGKRQQFHRRVAEVLEAQFPQTPATQPELVAHHFTEAGVAEKAAGYWLKAGLRSRDKSANIEAIGHLTKGLALVDTLGESFDRDSRELELLNLLAAAYQSARGYSAAEVSPIFERARELCRRSARPEQMFMMMWGNWAFRIVSGEFRLCTDLAAELMKVAQDLNDRGSMMEALYAQGATQFYRGDFAGAYEACSKAVDEFDDPERTKAWAALTHHNSSIMHRCYIAMSLWHLGYPEQAERVIREAVEMARAQDQPFGLCIALHQEGWLYSDCGYGVEGQTAGREEFEIASKHGFPMWQATGQFWIGAGLLRQGLAGEALPSLRQGLESYRATGSAISLSHYLSILGEACTQAGKFDEARQAIEEGIAVAIKNDERYQEAELHRLKGELHLAETNDLTAAEECFHTAIQTARRQRSKARELRAAMSLARLCQRQGRHAEAHAVLAPVYAAYTEGFTIPDLVESRALLEQAMNS
jgi:predicted ATPase